VKKNVLLLTASIFLAGCSQKNNQPLNESTGAANTQQAANYAPRIGIGVQTGSRTCIAIQNASLQSGTPITLVSPLPPQSFIQAQVTGPASSACPVSKELNPALSSYEVKPEPGNLQKLVPLIAVVSPATAFSTNNNNVQADLDQNGKLEAFRACTAADGYHLTAWAGTPLSAALVWHGYYYEPGNPGTGPACTPIETKGP
jgi:hypothetical protein